MLLRANERSLPGLVDDVHAACMDGGDINKYLSAPLFHGEEDGGGGERDNAPLSVRR